MSSITISGDTSGAVSIAAPAIAGTNTMTLAAGTGTLAPKVLSTAVASTSGTSIDFTNIPSWVTRITVMLSGVSTNGTSNLITQLGSGTFATSGYTSGAVNTTNGTSATSSAGLLVTAVLSATDTWSGIMIITNITGNVWVASNTVYGAGSTRVSASGGTITLSGTLDRVRITSASADTFDAGTVNIMYE